MRTDPDVRGPAWRAGKTASPEGLWTAKIVDFGLSKIVAQQRQRVLQQLRSRGHGGRKAPLGGACASPAAAVAVEDGAARAAGRPTSPSVHAEAPSDNSKRDSARGGMACDDSANERACAPVKGCGEEHDSTGLPRCEALAWCGSVQGGRVLAQRLSSRGTAASSRDLLQLQPWRAAHRYRCPRNWPRCHSPTTPCSHISLPTPSGGTPGEWEWRLKLLASSAVPLELSNPLYRVVVDNSLRGERFALTAETGSLMYMSPEVFRGEAYNEKADVFSFGVVMYEV